MTSVIAFEATTEAESGESNFDQRVRPRKSKSRHKGWRAGLASQTVIERLENPRDYRAFERSILASVGPRTVIELELIHRLASLLWRLRRATEIETGLLQMQGELLLDGARMAPAVPSPTKATDHYKSAPLKSTKTSDAYANDRRPPDMARSQFGRSLNRCAIAQCFLHFSRLDPALLDRAGAYELRLWRQAAQTILILDAIRRPVPSPARRPFRKAVPHPFLDFER
jgi:hypothetical protein